MRRLPSTSKYSAVVLSFFLAAAFGSALQPERSLQPDKRGAKVHCWNEAHVFDFVLPASEVNKHFPDECQDTLSCNTTCVAKVASRDVCARLKSRCKVPETQLGKPQHENKQQASFEKNFQQRLGGLDAKLARLLLESSYNKDTLVKLVNSLNHLGDAKSKQLSAASVKSLDSLVRKIAEMEALFNTQSKSMMTAISSILSLIKGDTKRHWYTLKGYAELKAQAIKYGSSIKMCDKVYIGRYLISWGFHFFKNKSGADLYFMFQIHRGISDEFLEWPFLNDLKLSIVHPESGKKIEGRFKPSKCSKADIKDHFSRPTWLNRVSITFYDLKFTSSHLERKGYVKADQLLLKLEMLT